jgi:hypothetical protein
MLNDDFATNKKQQLTRTKVADVNKDGVRRHPNNLLGATKLNYCSTKILDGDNSTAFVPDVPRVTVAINGLDLEKIYTTRYQSGEAEANVRRFRALSRQVRVESLAQIAYQLSAQNEFYQAAVSQHDAPADERTKKYAAQIQQASTTYNGILVMALGNAISKGDYKVSRFLDLAEDPAAGFVLDETQGMFEASHYDFFAEKILVGANQLATKLAARAAEKRGGKVMAAAGVGQ